MNNKLNKYGLMLSIFTMLSISVFCQNIFNKKAHISSLNESRTIFVSDTSYITIGIDWDSITSRKCLLFSVFDLNGYLEYKKKYCHNLYEYSINSYHSACVTSINPGYVYCASITDTVTDTIPDNSDILLVKYDLNGDTLFTRRYNFGYFDVGYSITESPDGGYMLCGTSRKYNPFQLCGRLIKVNTIGDIEWSQTYSCDYSSYFVNITPTTDGYCVSGQKQPGNQFNYSSSQLVYVNHVGGIKWFKQLGGPKDEYTPAITTLSDGHILSAGIYTDVQNDLGDPIQCRAYIVKLDSLNGGIIWEKKLGGFSNVVTPTFCYEQLDGSIIIGGARNNWIDESVFDARKMGFLMKLSPQGDSIWLREYFIDTTNVLMALLHSGRKTQDNGIVACGKVLHYDSTADTWLLKTDENGCIDAGCINGIEELEEDDYRLFIYPNPAQDYVSIDLPITYTKANLQIINMQGQLVKSVAINGGGLQHVDISTLPKGIYSFTIQSNNTLIGRQKVVVY